jgi:hypothetical protein
MSRWQKAGRDSGATGQPRKAHGEYASIVLEPRLQNGLPDCFERVKYRENSMGLAAQTYYHWTTEDRAFTRRRVLGTCIAGSAKCGVA